MVLGSTDSAAIKAFFSSTHPRRATVCVRSPVGRARACAACTVVVRPLGMSFLYGVWYGGAIVLYGLRCPPPALTRAIGGDGARVLELL